MTGILGQKLGMTRVIKDDGRVIPITVVFCEPNEITQIKTTDKDGYPAIVLGFSKLKKPTKNRQFYFKKEFKINEDEQYKKGDHVTLDTLKEVKKVSITAVSKGKGFQGVIKKHNFSRGPETHGSHHHRKPGSIGQCAKPGRVNKGKKMPGQLGNAQVTVRQVPFVYINEKNNLIGLKGPVPGPNKGLVIIRSE